LKWLNCRQQVQELVAKYQTQSEIDNQRNAKEIALANINNAADERIEMIKTQAQMTQQQRQMEFDQNNAAIEATRAAQDDIRRQMV